MLMDSSTTSLSTEIASANCHPAQVNLMGSHMCSREPWPSLGIVGVCSTWRAAGAYRSFLELLFAFLPGDRRVGIGRHLSRNEAPSAGP